MNKKAITFTIEALFGLTLCLLLIIIASVYLSRTPLSDTVMLSQFSLDTLAGLDHSQSLQQAISSNSSTLLQQYLDSLPPAFCVNLFLHNQQNDTLLSASKGNCSFDQKVIANRAFITSGGIYYAHLEGWWNYE